jgi:serine/threonine-protein kinase
MNGERWQEVKAVLESALQLDSAKRSAYLDQVCSSDPSLRREVESLLAADQEARSGFLEFPPLPKKLEPGARLGDYEIQSLLGAGGMGEVYRARDLRLRRDVAIKVLPAMVSTDPERLRRFEQEATAAAALSHPNILSVHYFGRYEDQPYIVSELLEGHTLRAEVKEGALPLPKVVDYGIQIARGLAAAYAKSIVHRDLKPENIFIADDGQVKILDFGLAKSSGGEGLRLDSSSNRGTATGAICGTVGYMSPEQVRSADVDLRTDLFSLGVVLYEMATGKRAFPGKSTEEVFKAILGETPLPPSQLNPALPERLDEIVGKALEKDPDLRYQSAADLLTDLEGLRRGTETTHTAPAAARGGNRWKIVGPAFVLLLAALAAAFWMGRERRGPGTTASQPRTPSIAVLPFVNISDDQSYEYFSDGLAEELLNDLAKIPGLRVAARTSSFRFKGKNEDVRIVGEKLNVITVLEGSVRKEGKRVRITAQLIKTGDGFHLWSETYDRELQDVFEVQDEIARSVAGSLKVKLLGSIVTPSVQEKNTNAYNAYLQGRYFFERRGKENLEKAIAYFEEAIKLDPDYAEAWAGLALTRFTQADRVYLPLQEGYRKAREAAERALALDPNLAEAHAAMGWIKKNYDWDWSGADASYQRALALEPGNATVVRGAAVLALNLGRFEQALSLDRRAAELDPLSASTQNNIGVDAYYAGRLDEAVLAVKKTLDLNPERPIAHWLLGLIYLAQSRPQEELAEMEREPESAYRLQGLALAYHGLGRKKESDAALAEYIAKYPADGAYQIAQIYALRGESDRAFEWLERAYAQRDSGLVQIKGDPLLKSIEHDPRHAAFLQKMRLPL